jgi:hypothetical protein
MERAMREEHRKDLEALERLKRLIHKNGDATCQAPDHKPQQIDAEYVDNNDDPLDLQEGLFPATIIGRVESIMVANTARRWTVPSMLTELMRQKFPLAAQKPASTLGLVFGKLHKRGRIRLVRRGSGRTPNVFRAVPPQTQEGDSDISQKSERATQGQPDHVH